MNKAGNIIISFALLSLFLVSCKKETEDNQPVYYFVYDFFATHGTPNQTFAVDASQGFSVTTAGGVIFIFQANSFKTVENTTAAGDITISIKEIGDYKDRIRNNVTSTTDGKFIYLSNECYITASQNNKPLSLIAPYSIAYPWDSYGITLLYGLTINTPANSNASSLNWQPDTATYSLQTINNANHICFTADKLGWVGHGDKWVTPIDKHTLTLNMPAGFYQSNTAIFISLHNNHMVGRVLPPNASSGTFTFNDVPNSMDFNVIAISFKDNKYYSYVYWVNQTTDLTIDFEIFESSVDDILTRINDLP